MRLISTSMLKEDMVLAKSIYYRDCLILKQGQTGLYRFSQSLSNMGIDYVYVEDDKSIGIEIPDAISEETRTTCKKIVRQTIEKVTNNTKIDVSTMSVAISSIVDEILQNPDVLISLSDIGAADEYTFTHSVSTTVYSLLIANKLGYNRLMLEKLAAGTMLHDLGKVLLDKSIIFKEGALSEDEFNYVKQHTTQGYEALKKCINLTELSRIISLYHHERMDGSGYPFGMCAGELHEFVRIVAVADVYDALISDRCYRKKWKAIDAVNYLVERSDTLFDTKVVATLIQQIAVYPNGSMVRLNNQSLGIVKEQNRSMPFRPIVRVITDNKGNEIVPYEIDLMKELNITIIESEIE